VVETLVLDVMLELELELVVVSSPFALLVLVGAEPDEIKWLPDGLMPVPDGLKPEPEGLMPVPDGLKTDPDGLTPEGLIPEPEGLPEGLMPEPEGRTPEGLIPEPVGLANPELWIWLTGLMAVPLTFTPLALAVWECLPIPLGWLPVPEREKVYVPFLEYGCPVARTLLVENPVPVGAYKFEVGTVLLDLADASNWSY